MEIVLGTATFGSNYGIANLGKILQTQECLEILEVAKSSGIRKLDTAPDYGDSEKIIGKCNDAKTEFKVYTKISASLEITVENVKKALLQSRVNLNSKALEGVYFHSPEKLLTSKKKHVNDVIAWIKASEVTKKIGVSVYDENQLKRISEEFPELNLFQVPENILDRRLLASPIVTQLKSTGCELNIRSVFLQGLLLMAQHEVPSYLMKAWPQISQLNGIAQRNQVSLESLCLSYAQSIDWASNVLIGVHSKAQLWKIAQHSVIKIDVEALPETLSPEILDPRRWVHS
jgi:aryl-alcohol dehydrogenase-like predicted oxidoreductase